MAVIGSRRGTGREEPAFNVRGSGSQKKKMTPGGPVDKSHDADLLDDMSS